MSNNTLNFIGFESDYDKADIIFFGVPFDGTVSFRPGTRFAPLAIRVASDGIETYSPYMEEDLLDIKVCDIGDVELPFGNTKKSLEIIENQVENIILDNKKLLMVGGEHLITYPVIKALTKKYDDLHIIHFDAHADLRDDYLGEKLSHATVLRRSHECLKDGKIWQFGIRSGTKEEFQWAKENVHMTKFDLDNIDIAIEEIKNKPVYITIDLDVLDPSVFSGTGTPEPGGVTFKELINAITKLKGLNVVGSDIVELSPHYDASDVSTVVACKIVREVALLL